MGRKWLRWVVVWIIEQAFEREGIMVRAEQYLWFYVIAGFWLSATTLTLEIYVFGTASVVSSFAPLKFTPKHQCPV